MRQRIALVVAILALLLIGIVFAKAQNGSPSPTPSTAQQKEFTDALAIAQRTAKEWGEIQSPCNATLSRAQTAEAQLSAAIFKIMAQMKLSPDEWESKMIDGKLSFAPKPEVKK